MKNVKKIRNIQNSFFLILLSVIANYSMAQTTVDSIRGCWQFGCSYGMERNDSGVWMKEFPTRYNDYFNYILLSDSLCVYLSPDCETKEYFLWRTNDDSIEIREGKECPYWRKMSPHLIHDGMCDSLVLETRYKNPNYICHEVWLKHKVQLCIDTLGKKIKHHKKVEYAAYNKRIIPDQVPVIVPGNNDTADSSTNIYIDRRLYKWLQRMTVSPEVEIHVVDYNDNGHYRVYVYIVAYNLHDKHISDVSYVFTYNLTSAEIDEQ